MTSPMPPEFLAAALDAVARRVADHSQNWLIGKMAAEALAHGYVESDPAFAEILGCSTDVVFHARSTWLRFGTLYLDPRYAAVSWRRWRAARNNPDAETDLLVPPSDDATEFRLERALDRMARLVDSVPPEFAARFADELASCELALRAYVERRIGQAPPP